jgi:hypothetical protein
MAKRTYVVGLRLALLGLNKYINRYEKQLRENMGDGPFAALLFVLDLVGVCLDIIEAGSDAEGDWEGPEPTLSSANITQINAAIAAYQTRAGLGGM